ncbi:MAG TPA: EpsG family protein [Mariprofundaceae bacterium]|nr:EpsG family protein [Mariprofundaceae bacterium]
MIAYWLLYLAAVFACISNAHPDKSSSQTGLWKAFGALAVLMIGFRFQVGGDWGSYLSIYQAIASAPESLHGYSVAGDFGYIELNLLMDRLGAGIYGVNLVCGMIFVFGLQKFARQQPLPWLAMAVAIPYLLVVVAMGYTRQAVALGFLFWGLSMLQRGRWKAYVTAIIMGALFHKTVVVCLPFALLGQERLMAIRWLPMAAITGAAGVAFLGDYYDALMTNYVAAGMESSGALVRVGLNLTPAILLLLIWRRWKEKFGKDGPWRWMALMTLGAMVLLPIASTAVDRMALYLAPLQLVVWSRVPLLFATVRARTFAIATILGLYATVLFVWLTYATHARYWLPYQNVIFQ